MHVISYRKLREFYGQHADCQDALDNWYRVAIAADWSNLIEVHSAKISIPKVIKRSKIIQTLSNIWMGIS
jgi:mRNA-degrading endonuclease HigB of HigAB toxin-antitoxin module